MFDFFDVLFNSFNIGISVSGICLSWGICVSQTSLVKISAVFKCIFGDKMVKVISILSKGEILNAQTSYSVHFEFHPEFRSFFMLILAF
jgi:hypothetical protein